MPTQSSWRRSPPNYVKRSLDRNFGDAQWAARDLERLHQELYLQTVTDELQTQNRADWAVAFFSAPPTAVGANPITSLTIKAIADYSWLTRKQADWAIEFIVPASTKFPGQVLQMLQHAPFRAALRAKATPAVFDDLAERMPFVRITANAEDDVATKAKPVSITDIADSVFEAFLGDQDLDLVYATVSTDFRAHDFLVGDPAASRRAPCMTISNVLIDVLKAVLPAGDPLAIPVLRQDLRPMLTRKLATIGTDGILTRDTAFYGNVDRFGNEVGYANVNRVFFGDGHEWLEVAGKEYCPTLGVSGPGRHDRREAPTARVHRQGDKFTSSDGKTATAANASPSAAAGVAVPAHRDDQVVARRKSAIVRPRLRRLLLSVAPALYDHGRDALWAAATVPDHRGFGGWIRRAGGEEPLPASVLRAIRGHGCFTRRTCGRSPSARVLPAIRGRLLAVFSR